MTFSKTNSSNLTLNNWNGTLYVSCGNNNNLNLNNNTTWRFSNNTWQNLAGWYEVTKEQHSAYITDFTVDGVLAFTTTGSSTYTHTNAQAIGAYNKYTFSYNGGTTYYSTDDSKKASTTAPTGTTDGITYTYSLSSNSSGYATVDSSTGEVTVSQIPATGSRTITLTVTASKNGFTSSTATKDIILTSEDHITETGWYVIYFSNADVYLGGTNKTAISTFSPSTCLWTVTNNIWKNSAGGYLYDNDDLISTTSGSACTLSSNESGTTGRIITLPSGNYVRYKNTYPREWQRGTYSSNLNNAYAVTKNTYFEKSTAPTISGDSEITIKGNNNSFKKESDASYTMAYIDYVFYNNTSHKFDMDNATTLSSVNGNFTYTWSLTGIAAEYAEINSSTGVINYKKYVTSDVTATVTLTATSTSPNKTLTATQTVTFKKPAEPTGISITSGSPMTVYKQGEEKTITYTLTGATTPVYDDVTFASSATGIATVDNTGKLVPVAPGQTTVTLTAKTTSGGTGATTTVTVNVRDWAEKPLISFTPVDDGDEATVNITCSTPNVNIYYTTDGTEPTASNTLYNGSFTVNEGDVVKAKAFIKPGTANESYWDPSAITESQYLNCNSENPAISISNNQVSFSSPEADADFYYTIDGSTPDLNSTKWDGNPFTPDADECTIKVIANNGRCMNSEVVSRQYVRGSGVSGGVVTLNDFEDHTWTYYAGVSTDVDGGYYNTNYAGKMYSPNPRNVKITYNANGGAVSINESETSFVYYETIEKVNNAYTYQVISNPFSKRPKTDGKIQGFAGWKIVDGDEYISGKSENDVLGLDEVITLENLSYESVNCISAEIVLEATWTDATVTNITSNNDATISNSGTYETNLVVIKCSYSKTLTINGPCTIMMVEPDGTDDYRDDYTLSSGITPADLHDTGKTTKIEFAHWQPGNAINPQGRNFTIGRGMTMDGTARALYGTSTNTTVNQVLKVESGKFSSFDNFGTGLSSGYLEKQWVIFGNDYDRAKNTDGITSNLEITGAMYISEGDNVNASSGQEVCRVYSKSGKFVTSKNVGTAEAGQSYYFGFSNRESDEGYKYLEIQGGEWLNIAGGMGTSNTSTDLCTIIRMKGGVVKGSIYGAAQYSGAAGTRLMVFTGGTVKGWIAGGANGTQDSGGLLTGATYVYVGGNTNVNSNGSETLINSSVGGIVFGAGCGFSTTSTSGQVTAGTNVVVADNAYIERGVYGGGSFGYCATDKTSYIYITGGHVEGKAGGVNVKTQTQYSFSGTTTTATYTYTNSITGGVFGGACQNKGGSSKIYMTGGLVEGGIYGGSNSSGTLSGSVEMQINGGQVGQDASHTANIHGGGYGSATIVSQNVDITLGKTGADRDADGVTVYGDVYGGSALGSVNGTAATTTYHTNVTMNAGEIYGSLYGGALGQKNGVNGATSDIAAYVYGPVAVTINGGKVIGEESAVYGCNNVNGAPQRAVSVTVNHTDSHNNNGTANNFADDIYAINAVYGGGNRAAYTYGIPTVTVNNCNDNSIKYVYGGGNQATVPSTNVTINGGDVIGNVFGGGNNANITGTSIADANKGTRVNIKGGRILNVYGGNNNGGTITGTIKVDVAEASNSCGVDVDDLYGGGNKAASNAGTITIGKCSRIDRVFGGANQANVTGPINLTITDGHINNVFGGNNNSGNITGAITVNVEWASGVSTENARLGNVYGGGNIASYSAYGYNSDGTPKTTGDKVAGPTVNIKNATTTGSVFGGGKGKDAVVYGDPVVNIGQWGSGSVIIGQDVFGGGDLAAVEGNPTVTIRDCGTIINHNLYGGGNAAPVYSTNTTVWGGNILGNVFGGGNGEDPEKNVKGAQVGYKSDDAAEGGTGNATTNIYGGKFGTWSTGDNPTCTDGTGGIFGGSNTTGKIRGTINVTLNKQACEETGASSCDLILKEAYGSGNQAAYEGSGITFNLGCVDAFDEIYGGAKQADMTANIHLKITSGHFKKVFGGNNLGGCINGSIKVTIDETGCHPVIIDELYGGGNQAAYSIYGYNNDKTIIKTGEAKYLDPEVNIVSCSHIGQVFGGGYGASAVVAGNPIVNIQQIPGKFVPEKAINGEDDDTNTEKLGTIGTVFGGGNAANVVGDTHVNIGTAASVVRADGSNATVKGANITGNVYGGGNAADVTGKTHVQVGPTPTN